MAESLEQEDFSNSPEGASPAPPSPPPTPEGVAAPQPAPETAGKIPPDSLRRNPWVAAFLSALPGLGHVYNGLYKRGVLVLAIVATCIALVDRTGSPIFGFALVFAWMFGILDSYRQAVLINHGLSADPWVGLRQGYRPDGQEKLLFGGLLFLGGSLEMLTRIGLFQWEYLFDYGFVIFMIIGGGLMISALKQKKRRELEEREL